ncbi:MAG: A/G-specific adenine glycosylase [Agathobacter sp.]|nr:A/G-specific adenine glycosylase [Agathobacter sp.]
MIDNYNLVQLVNPLQTWFQSNARVLPWRENPTAYYVWISEIMLQQTRVEAVKPYFDRFIRELPDVKALAECPEDKLLKLWEGLGYYNRARNLKIAANQIIDQYGGVIPDEYEELLKLKGIGHYTAGAIASIAYGKAVPAVDGNVLRVISRVTADDSDIMKQSVRTHMEEKLQELMNADLRKNETCKPTTEVTDKVIPSIFNQALMELGATVCLPNGAPRCEVCPWHDLCEARKQDRIAEIPVKTKAKARRIEKRTVFIIKDGEQLALRKRPGKGLLAGLYELPNVEGYLTEQEAVAYIEAQGYIPIRIQPACEAKHIFSHVEWHMKGYVVFLQAQEFAGAEQIGESELQMSHMPENPQNWLFVDVEDTKENYAIPSAFVKYAEYLNMTIGKDAIEKT